MALSTRDGGMGLVTAHRAALRRASVKTWFEASGRELIQKDGAVVGIVVEREGKRHRAHAAAVVLAAGRYELSTALRKQHLGDKWENARVSCNISHTLPPFPSTPAQVRATRYKTGDGISMARAIGAWLAGDWSGCHATCWDAHAPADRGDCELSNRFTKSGYPLGVMARTRGTRFVDEGADFRNYTYAAYRKAVLRQGSRSRYSTDGKPGG